MIPPDLSALSPKDQQRIMPFIQYNEINHQIQLLNSITNHCFNACVTDLSTTTILKREQNCVKKCFEKLQEYEQRGQYKMGERQAIEQVKSMQQS